MAEISSINNISWSMWPFYTDRTAWKPFGLPMVLIAPHSRDNFGNDILNSDPVKIRIYFAQTGPTPVAGHDHIGIFKPNEEQLSIELNRSEINNRLIYESRFTYLNNNNEEVDEENATKIKFMTNTGITDTIEYIRHADYYDISDVLLDTSILPEDKYILTYEAIHYRRSISDNDELLCIDTDNLVSAYFRLPVKHPGDVIQQAVNSTPGLYFTDAEKSKDTTIEFYRPFTEILQDIHDEQDLLKTINWVHTIRPEFVPYLGFLLGWELPYFPSSADSLRKATLRNIVKLQKLKGSKRAARELFDLFGFVIDISNVWWTPDGKSYLGPGESNDSISITKDDVVTIDPLLVDYSENGFGNISVPITNRILNNKLTLKALIVEKDTDAYNNLIDISNNLSNDFNIYNYDLPDTYDFLDVSDIDAVKVDNGIVGWSDVLIGNDGYPSDIQTGKKYPLSQYGIKHNYVTNILEFDFSSYIDFDNSAIFVFAVYGYNKIIVPDSMRDLQSNRFDVSILGTKSGDEIDTQILLFLVDFLFKVKAFHSLLRKILYTLSFNESYLVSDYCFGGSVQQILGSDAGNQQVPPEAVIPDNSTESCFALSPEDYGFRTWDVEYRNRVIDSIEEEFEAWKRLSDDCGLTYRGQDRFKFTDNIEDTSVNNAERFDFTANKNTLCELDGSDYCYKGRVTDVTTYTHNLKLSETWLFKCGLSFAKGVYYTYPNGIYLNDNKMAEYLNAPKIQRHDNYLSDIYRAYGVNQEYSVHYTDSIGLDDSVLANRLMAVQRPSLYIEKDNLYFPGHRMPHMNAVESTYVSSDWKHKPWDFGIKCECNSISYDNVLNATIYIGSDGDEYLDYDNEDYTIYSNGLSPDISSFSEHLTGSSYINNEDDVTHAVYMHNDGEGHESISLDNTVDAVGIINVDEPLFSTAIDVGVSSPEYIDISDGYPASTGFISNPDAFDYFPSSSDSALLADLLGIDISVGASQLLFTASSQIRVDQSEFNYHLYAAYRVDCGCVSIVEGSSTDVTVTTDVTDSFVNDYEIAIGDCSLGEFLPKYGDVSLDQYEYDIILSSNEEIGAETLLLDGKAKMFELLQLNGVTNENGYPGDTPFPDSGSFIYKDDYGIIHNIYWNTIGSLLDFIVTTKDPRIPGVEKSGRIFNREVYHNGVVTTIRQVFELIDGEYIQIAYGKEQKIEEFKSSFTCRNPFTDPFANRLNNNIVDEVEYEVVVGPHWTSAEEDTDSVDWSEVGTGEDFWTDIWSN